MEIKVHFALLVGICLGVPHAAEEPIHIEIADLSQLCSGRLEGHLVPHPYDCNAYFACATIPTLLYCDQGLKFDAVDLKCVGSEQAQCGAMESLAGTTISTPKFNMDWWEHKPQPVFVAVDVNTGQPVNPMEKYDPEHVECRHFGAYFLPHPKNCQQYFICAYGHLHRHQCGGGTLWNYKSSECQLSDNAECYATGNSNHVPGVQPSRVPGNPITVCYVVNQSPTEREREPTTSINVTPSVQPTVSIINALTCPSDRQSYLPHPEDCSKYYICIMGKPVLTSCPKGLFWDQKAGYCDQAKNVKCFQNE